MKLSGDQLIHYLENMNERAIKALENDFKIHGFMIYQCKDCKSIYVMWLAEGLEDPTNDRLTGNHKPVPFGIVCPACGGEAYHEFWGATQWSLSMSYRSYKDYISQQGRLLYENFFWNDPESDCGVPIIINPDYPFGLEADKRCVSKILINVHQDFFPNSGFLEFPDCTLIDEKPSPKERSVEVFLDGLRNRYERRHPNQHDGYKRPRSNKKLYEY